MQILRFNLEYSIMGVIPNSKSLQVGVLSVLASLTFPVQPGCTPSTSRVGRSSNSQSGVSAPSAAAEALAEKLSALTKTYAKSAQKEATSLNPETTDAGGLSPAEQLENLLAFVDAIPSGEQEECKKVIFDRVGGYIEIVQSRLAIYDSTPNPFTKETIKKQLGPVAELGRALQSIQEKLGGSDPMLQSLLRRQDGIISPSQSSDQMMDRNG